MFFKKNIKKHGRTTFTSNSATQKKLVGRARFALTKPPKRHIKHELDAHLSTSTLYG